MKSFLKIQPSQTFNLNVYCKSACSQKSSHYVNCKFDENKNATHDSGDNVDSHYRSTCSSNLYTEINNAFNGVHAGDLIKASQANDIIKVARKIAYSRARTSYEPSEINHYTTDTINDDVYEAIRDFINGAIYDVPGWGPDQINTADTIPQHAHEITADDWEQLRNGLKRVASSCHLNQIDYCPSVCSCDKVCDCDCNSNY